MDIPMELDMDMDAAPVASFVRRAAKPPPDPASDFIANVVSLLRARLGLEKARAIARTVLDVLAQAPAAGQLEAPGELARLSAEERLSIKIWLLDLAAHCAEKFADRQLREAYEAATRANISGRLGL